MKKIKGLNLLDCTLRDGGYYNNWDFSEELINDYLVAVNDSEIEYCEIGFRSLKNDSYKGPLAFSKDDFISLLNVPKNLKLGVMINANELIQGDNLVQKLEQLFPRRSENSLIKLVRVACYYEEFAQALPASLWLNSQGYKVGFNIMQISERQENELEIICELVKKFPVEVLYFADSLGSMTLKDTKNVIKHLKNNCKIPLGCHFHDNLGLALNNSLFAIENGITWVDSTITGMGRGPGNCQTEEILIELLSKFNSFNTNDVSTIINIISKHFEKLKQKYKWGKNIYYYLSGKLGIHPSYLQNIIADPIFSHDDRLAFINQLAKRKLYKFDSKYLSKGMLNLDKVDSYGKFDPKQIFKDREVLILATGPSSKKYSNEIERYIKKKKPLVIALNTPTPINIELINIRAACHPVRMLMDANFYQDMDQSLLCPYSMLVQDLKKSLNNTKILDYGLVVEDNKFKFFENYCIIPEPLVLFYVLSAAIAGEASQILLTGVDGYEGGDPRNANIEKLFEHIISNSSDKIQIFSITPSIHRVVNQKSIFGL